MKTKKGSILAYALIILTMMAVISVAMTTTTILERKSSSATDSSTQAYQTADTGAQLGIKLINSVTAPDATLDDAFTLLPVYIHAMTMMDTPKSKLMMM